MKTWRLYWLLIRASVRSRMQYKFNFLFSAFASGMIHLLEFLTLAILLARFGTVKGWSLYEVGYLYSTLILSYALYRTFANDVHRMEPYFVNGTMDSLLLRPVPVLLALMTQNFNIMLGHYVQGGAVLAVSLSALIQEGQISWTAIPLTGLTIVSGAIILFAIGLATATTGFWTMRISELQNLTEDASRFAAQYPLSIYPAWMQGILLFVVPVGFASYVPALYVIKHSIGFWVIPVTVIFAGLLLVAAFRFWRLGLTRYQSSGH